MICKYSGCTGLTEVNYNATNCTYMAGNYYYNVFEGCTSLTILNIGDNVQNIPAFAFLGCTGLTSITIPSSVTSIGSLAFSGCTGLTSIYFEATTPPSIGSSIFPDYTNFIIYVPQSSVDAYKKAWRYYRELIQGY